MCCVLGATGALVFVVVIKVFSGLVKNIRVALILLSVAFDDFFYLFLSFLVCLTVVFKSQADSSALGMTPWNM